MSGLVLSVGSAGAALAQEGPSASVQVQIAAADPDAPAAIALVSLAEGGDTAVQVLAPGAPEATSVVIHQGTCAQVSPTMVGLVGTIGREGGVQAVIPVPFATVVDGRHVIALHRGLDLASALACGEIPALTVSTPTATSAAEPLAVATPLAPERTASPQVTVAPPAAATPDAACTAIRAWIAARRADLGVLSRLNTDATRAGADVPRYLSTLATNVGALRAMIAEAVAESVTPEVAIPHERFVTALTLLVEASDTMIRAYTEADPSAFQEALAQADEVNSMNLEFQKTLGELEARCSAAPAG